MNPNNILKNLKAVSVPSKNEEQGIERKSVGCNAVATASDFPI